MRKLRRMALPRPVRGSAALPAEIAGVWAMVLLVSSAIFVTYSRVPPNELYHVSGHGLAGGASRVIVFANFSTALVAVPVLALLADLLRSRETTAAAIAGVVLCAAVVWPGVVDEADLDVRPVNSVAAAGVLVALALTVLAARHGLAWSGRQRGDAARVVAAAAALFAGLPWIAAELGFYLDGVPLLGDLFLTGERPSPFEPPAVHHGHHHGTDGLLLVLCALLLSRAVPRVGRRGLRVTTGAYLAVLASYGIANLANDFWTEQVFKRGWTSREFPDVLHPTLSLAWALILLAAVALYAIAARGRARVRAGHDAAGADRGGFDADG
jgi:hypothetical protein